MCYTVGMQRSSFPHHRDEQKHQVIFSLTLFSFFLVLPVLGTLTLL